MKTNHLYYYDAYLRTFTARIVEWLVHEGRPAVVLDQTAFYPAGGGQPHDLGRLGEVQVADVVERESDGAVLHMLSAENEILRSTNGLVRSGDFGRFGERYSIGDEMIGEVDWARRFDHMQQHTGQHILSQAFTQVARAETIGFHLGEEVVTIDLDRVDLSPTTVERVEELANQVVFEDRPVVAHFVSPDELERLPLRKPPKIEEDIRVVQVKDFDWSACGGTHVSSAGQVGLIKIIRLERRGNEMRVEFRCGWRALADYHRKNEVITGVAASLSVGYWELDEAIARLQAEAKDARKKLAKAEGKLMMHEADELAASAQDVGPFVLVVRAWPDRDAASLRLVAQRIIERPRMAALLGSAGDKRSALVFARSDDVDLDMSVWLRQAAQRIGGRGGGQPDLAQGGGGPASLEQVQAALDWVFSQIVQ